jgi:hypothetical protein
MKEFSDTDLEQIKLLLEVERLTHGQPWLIGIRETVISMLHEHAYIEPSALPEVPEAPPSEDLPQNIAKYVPPPPPPQLERNLEADDAA